MITNRDVKVFLSGMALVATAWGVEKWSEPADLNACRCALSDELRMVSFYRDNENAARAELSACVQGCKK